MAIIKPAELCDYVKVLPQVKPGSPVYLTVNGCTRYVIRDVADDKELEGKEAMLHLLLALNEGRLSGEMDGYPRMMSAIVSIHKTDDAIIATVEDTM